MVDIMREEWGPFLINLEVDDGSTLPTLDVLRKRILIKVKYSAPDKAAKKRAQSAKGAEVEAESSEEDDQTGASQNGHIIPALGSMGMYTRSYHFKSFDQPEAKLPCHVFSLSESKLIDTNKRDPAALFHHNKVRFEQCCIDFRTLTTSCRDI